MTAKPPPSSIQLGDPNERTTAPAVDDDRGRRRPPWLDVLRKYCRQPFTDASTDYPPPDWLAWMDRGLWDTLSTVPPLLLKHDPVRAMGAPYYNAEWCEAHLDRYEVRVMRTVILAACEGEFGTRMDTDPPIAGYRVKPLDAVRWALALASIDPPAELLDAAARKRQRLAAAEALMSGQVVVSPPFDSEPVPLPQKMNLESRGSFAAFVALRYARLPVSGAAGTAQIADLGVKEPHPRYLAPSGHYALGFDELAAWADAAPRRWARVLDALRLWTGAGGDDASG